VLDEIARPYTGRELGLDEILALRDALTRAYVDRGYATSGVVVPDQALDGGVLVFQAVEGRVTSVEVETDGRLRESYVRSRIELALGPPVNVNEIENQLRILQQDARIRAVRAALTPSERRGEAVLHLSVVEARPWHLRLRGNDYASPVIGSGRGEVRAGHSNVTGFGDELWAEYQVSSGLHDVRASWDAPLTRWDTRAGIHFRRTWSEVVEEPFDDLDIESRTETYGFGAAHPFYRTPETRVLGLAIGEWRRSRSYLFGDGFAFVPGPDDDGEARLTALRAGSQLDWRAPDTAVAARTMVSFGLPILDATENSPREPDGEFIAWLVQIEGARRFSSLLDLQVVARADLQLSDRPLLGLEQFAIGGHDTVRGYRENRLVRDNGVIGSLELRLPVPVPFAREWRPRFAIAPFVDAGYGWNTDRPEPGDDTLVAAGIGGRFGLLDAWSLEIYWGESLTDVATVGDDVQDDGVHIGLTWEPAP
jgi:hemolysin activation/secretion protein